MVAASSSSELKLPTNSAQLVDYLERIDHDEETIRRNLIPALNKLASSAKGDKVLASVDRAGEDNDPLSKYMVEGIAKSEIEERTVELVYMLYVCALS